MNLIFKEIKLSDIDENILDDFVRYQKIDKQVIIENDEEVVVDDNRILEWNDSDKKAILNDFKSILNNGGFIFGCYDNLNLVGFGCLENLTVDVNSCPLFIVQVCNNYRRLGIGKVIFDNLKKWAKDNNFDKIYISANNSIETYNFYKKIGAKRSKYVYEKYAKKKPKDIPVQINL